jgi:hypothetical protein
MSTLGIDASPLTPAGAWLLEEAGRLKLNGQVRGHSPLSPLVELEGLEAGVSGKRSLWQVIGGGDFRQTSAWNGLTLMNS